MRKVEGESIRQRGDNDESCRRRGKDVRVKRCYTGVVQEKKVMTDEDGSQIKHRRSETAFLRHHLIGRRSSTGNRRCNSGYGHRDLPSTSNAAGASVSCAARCDVRRLCQRRSGRGSWLHRRGRGQRDVERRHRTRDTLRVRAGCRRAVPRDDRQSSCDVLLPHAFPHGIEGFAFLRGRTPKVLYKVV